MPLYSASYKRMNFIFKSKEIIKKFLFICLFLLVLVFQIDFRVVNALPMDNYQNKLVTEELRLKIPRDFKEVWLDAEKNIWEPWLSSQDGFIERQIFWDKNNEEALILVSWRNKKSWKSIPMKVVNKLQEEFEENVKTALNTNVNPFELIYEGELYPQ